MGVLDLFRLDGRVAVVTGASRNIGLQISHALAEAGSCLFMVARGKEQLEAAAGAVRAVHGTEVYTVVADVGAADGTERIVSAVHDLHPQAHVLVNNACALDPWSDALSIAEDQWHAAFAVNVLGPYRLCSALGRRMMQGDGGSIINMVSGTGILPNPGGVPIHYGATKAAMWMMTRYLAAECAPKVRVNALVPGTVNDDDEAWGNASPAALAKSLAAVPMGRIGRPQEVAPAALYLASDASSYTTGTLLFVNGGRAW